MHKNNALWLLLHLSSIMLGAASSSSYVPLQSNEVIAMSLAHLPIKVKQLTNSISIGETTSGAFLFVGPPGTGKTTSAKSIAEEFYRENGHVFHGSDLVGNQYQNSGVMALQQRIDPIIERSKHALQMIVVDEFQKLLKKSKRQSSEQTKAESKMLKLFDAMRDSQRIIFVGTCNRTTNLSAPILSRFRKHFIFEQAPRGLYLSTLDFYLKRTGITTEITTTKALKEIVDGFPFELRSVEDIVESAKVIAVNRTMEHIQKSAPEIETITQDDIKQSAVILKEDLLEAIQDLQVDRTPTPLTWSKWTKKHHEKIVIVATATGIIIAGAGLYFAYKHYKEGLANHVQERAEDLARHAAERTEDLRLADDRFKQGAADELARKVIHATNPWCIPKFLYYPYATASEDVKAEIAKNDAVYYAGVKDTIVPILKLVGATTAATAANIAVRGGIVCTAASCSIQ